MPPTIFFKNERTCMCSLCGLLGEDHWTDMTAHVDAFGGKASRTRRHERLYRVSLINKILDFYALRLDDWQGQSFILSSRTGKTEIVDDLMAVWPAAEGMIGRKLDPMDPDLLARLDKRAGRH